MTATQLTASLPDLPPADVNIVLQGLVRQRDHINDLIAQIEAAANASLAKRATELQAQMAAPPAVPADIATSA